MIHRTKILPTFILQIIAAKTSSKLENYSSVSKNIITSKRAKQAYSRRLNWRYILFIFLINIYFFIVDKHNHFWSCKYNHTLLFYFRFVFFFNRLKNRMNILNTITTTTLCPKHMKALLNNTSMNSSDPISMHQHHDHSSHQMAHNGQHNLHDGMIVSITFFFNL